MGDINQFNWIKKHSSLIRGPVLEIGSKHYSKEVSINYRDLCQGQEYIGTDMQHGANVDIVIDFTSDLSEIEDKLGGREVNTIICCSVLEHVDNVFKMAENIGSVLKKDGVLFVSVPFTWRFHGYPNDYWRFTPEGLKYLFKDFDFPLDRSSISSNLKEDVLEGIGDPNSFIVKPIKKDFTIVQRALIKFRLAYQQFQNYHYVLLPSNISMVGIKKS